jgi:hypothetical protein
MTWRELVFEICNKIPDEQFDEEAKIVLNDHVFGPVFRLHKNAQDWYLNQAGDDIVSRLVSDRRETPIIKQGEFTIE